MFRNKARNKYKKTYKCTVTDKGCIIVYLRDVEWSNGLFKVSLDANKRSDNAESFIVKIDTYLCFRAENFVTYVKMS